MLRGPSRYNAVLRVPAHATSRSGIERLTIPGLIKSNMSRSKIGSSSMSKSRSMLLSLLGQDSDVVLVFTDKGGTTEEVPAHSQTLGQWSEVLRNALRAECGASSSSGSKFSSSIPKIPMDGTEKEDWLLAMEFVYPVVPQPEVTWDNLERLLLLGDKYGMPALMERVSTFVKHNAGELNLNQKGQCYVWKWVFTLDSYGLPNVAKTCIDRQPVLNLMDACPKPDLFELSRDTLQHVVLAMHGALPRPGMKYCHHCMKAVNSHTKSRPAGSTGFDRCCSSCYSVL